MKTVAIVQARMDSTRFPGKVLRPILGTPLIEILLQRLGRATQVDQIVLATSAHPTNDELAAHAYQLGITVFRGSEDDVLDRYHAAAGLLRQTSWCVSPGTVRWWTPLWSMRHWSPSRAPPWTMCRIPIRRLIPDGLDVEVFTFDALRTAWRRRGIPRAGTCHCLHARAREVSRARTAQ